ncbi:MAG: hypothetical protein JWO36_2796 [Myxococcales bacterium]|nr:hypothetical protein [Myxococcales bacterium]
MRLLQATRGIGCSRQTVEHHFGIRRRLGLRNGAGLVELDHHRWFRSPDGLGELSWFRSPDRLGGLTAGSGFRDDDGLRGSWWTRLGGLREVKLALVGLLVASVASAEKPTIVALVPGSAADDARLAIAIGPGGQTYEPDGKGVWSRRHAGGVAADVINATRIGNAVIVGAKDAPPFELAGGVWTSVFLGLHAKALVGSGSRPTAAVGRSIFALDRVPPARVATAPGLVIALAASATAIIVETEAGVFRLEGSRATPLAPTSRITYMNDRWAIGDKGAIDLRTAKIIPWPADVAVVAASSTSGDTLIAVGVTGDAVELVSLRGGKLDREAIPVDRAATIIGIVADRTGRIVVALADGRLAVRDQGTWTITTVRDALPDPRRGAPPASSG